ncbi:SPOR domain-containing protein [Flavobacterium sedimenticola]|uniref:SPOR domain-containing protein n=1 Tax=Flavobacterium sedimenticola TaxID=3043286 RepID=A0ABT6XL63_9FLAO|nr:SPOR domain-containing protein [Flavobacterium sedimenticola]MDI9255821.1 SPOR domain-containing protein [Flavobacterium sedimenticola]
MTILTKTKLFYLTLSLLFFTQKSRSQEEKVTLHQDPKFEQLLNEKRKINSSITINDRYKIQIFNGDSENSKKTLIDFKKEYKTLDATIVFSTPQYKVWVGNFKTRIEAEKNLELLKKRYPNAFLIKPNK